MASTHLTLKQAERAFLDASIEVWREIDRLEAEGPYPGIPSSTASRERERAAWVAYRDLLDAHAMGA